MFYYLSGELAYVDLTTCVIDCGGVGYKLTVSQTTSGNLHSKINTRVKLFTHLAVREDGVELFGFGSGEERECFNQLTSVSGVGPKAAMSILSTFTPTNLALAICTEDTRSISKSPSIGPKTAARIVLELKDKMSKNMMSSSQSTISTSAAKSLASGNISEACEALMVLGYDKNTILSVVKDIDPMIEVGEIIKQALKKLTR